MRRSRRRQQPDREVAHAIFDVDKREKAERREEGAGGHHAMAAVTVDQSPNPRRHQPATRSARKKPPIAKVVDQPRSAAINGKVSTVG